MRLVVILFLTVISIGCYAQKEIKLEELNNHIGDSVKVRGKVYGVRYLQSANNTPTFINIGAAYPNQVLTVVIWGDVRKKLTYNPEEKKYATGMAIVTGKVELYREKPQIVIRGPEQLVFLYDEEVPVDQIPPIEKKAN